MSTHGIAIHTIGDILILGVVLWMVMWAPWTRNRRPAYREERAVYREDGPADDGQVGVTIGAYGIT